MIQKHELSIILVVGLFIILAILIIYYISVACKCIDNTMIADAKEVPTDLEFYENLRSELVKVHNSAMLDGDERCVLIRRLLLDEIEEAIRECCSEEPDLEYLDVISRNVIALLTNNKGVMK